jgi:ADP-heptose:LPS heptosyltransferase
MKILVVKTHAFGDSLLATPAVGCLVRRGDSVTVLSGPSSLPVWERFPGLDSVIQSPAPCSPRKLLLWSLKNRQLGFDKVIHLGTSAGAVRWLRVLTGRKPESGVYSVSGATPEKPAAADYCRIAGVECSDLKPVFHVYPDERAASALITGGRPYVVLAPGGARNARDYVVQKRWPISRWNEVSQFLQDRGFQVFLAGGETDRVEISGLNGVNLGGKLTWGETAALIAGAVLFAGNDSGPAHLAVAEGTPALVLFGPTDPDSLYEKGSIVSLCGNASCSPCYANSVFPGCKGDGNCMAAIETERVLNILEGMLQR